MGNFIKVFSAAAICAVGVLAQAIDWNAANITITNEAQLREFARLTDAKQKKFSGQTVTLGNDINIQSSSKNRWKPIGDFAGTFDGNGRVISGIYISGSDKGQGFFSYLGKGGSIKNLNIVVNIEGYDKVAGLAVLNFGVIENSYVSGNVSGRDFVGGLAAANSGVIKNCYFAGTVKGYNYTGKLAGVNSGAIKSSYALSSGDFMNLVGFKNSGANIIIKNSYILSSGDFMKKVEPGAIEKAALELAAAEQAAELAAKNKAAAELAAREQAAKNKAEAELAAQDKTAAGQTTEQEQIEEPAPTIGFLGVLGVGIAGLGSAMMEGGLRAGEGYSGADKFKKIDWKAFGFGSGVAAGGLALALIADFIPFIKHRVKERRAKIAAEHVQLGITLDGNYYAGVRFDF